MACAILTIILCSSGCYSRRFWDTGSNPICCAYGDASDVDLDVRPCVEGVKIFLGKLIRHAHSRFALFRICFASQIGQPECQGRRIDQQECSELSRGVWARMNCSAGNDDGNVHPWNIILQRRIRFLSLCGVELGARFGHKRQHHGSGFRNRSQSFNQAKVHSLYVIML